jgi:hypothetical protein
MSASPPEADTLIVGINVRFVPVADMRRALGAQIDAACLRRSAPGADLAGVDPTPLRSRWFGRLHPTFFAPYNSEFGR